MAKFSCLSWKIVQIVHRVAKDNTQICLSFSQAGYRKLWTAKQKVVGERWWVKHEGEGGEIGRKKLRVPLSIEMARPSTNLRNSESQPCVLFQEEIAFLRKCEPSGKKKNLRYWHREILEWSWPGPLRALLSVQNFLVSNPAGNGYKSLIIVENLPFKIENNNNKKEQGKNKQQCGIGQRQYMKKHNNNKKPNTFKWELSYL